MYTAGEVYISSIIDTLTAQACYNPHIVTILQQILVGKNFSGTNKFEEALEQAYGDKFSEGNIWQIPVPEEMVNKTFDLLFKFLLDRNLVALGLYRLPGAIDNSYPYVSTNPSPSLNITMRDRVFVLGNHIPRDLILDYNRNDGLQNDVAQSRMGSKKSKGDLMIRSSDQDNDFYGTKKGFSPLLQQNQQLHNSGGLVVPATSNFAHETVDGKENLSQAGNTAVGYKSRHSNQLLSGGIVGGTTNPAAVNTNEMQQL